MIPIIIGSTNPKYTHKDCAIEGERLVQCGVVDKIFKSISLTPLDQLPPLVHHLFILGKGSHEAVLLQLMRHFDRLDTLTTTGSRQSERKQLLSVEGTVVLHFNFACKQDTAVSYDDIMYHNDHRCPAPRQPCPTPKQNLLPQHDSCRPPSSGCASGGGRPSPPFASPCCWASRASRGWRRRCWITSSVTS